MRFSSFAVKLGALGLCAAAVALGGCFGDGLDTDPSGGGFSETQGTPSPDPQTLDIDTGATITATGGNGVGIFIEYTAGGTWTVFTACDTNISGDDCDIDVYVAPVDANASIGHVTGTDFQGMDAIEVQSDGTTHMFVETTTGLDGMTFSATPGAAMEFEVFLGNELLSQYVYWIGDGILHTGSPTDPVNLTPVAPAKGAGGAGGGTSSTGGAGGGSSTGGADGGV